MRCQPDARVWVAYCLLLAILPGRALSTEYNVDPACPSLAAVCNCCDLCPCGYAWVDGLVVTRDNDVSSQPLVIDLNTLDVLLTADDLDFDWTGGVRAGYGRRICGCLSLEFGYLGIFELTGKETVELEDSLTLPDDFGLQVNNFFAADEVTICYESDLHSGEANLVFCCYSCDAWGRSHSIEWLTGFRYISLNESLSISAFDSEEGTSTYRVRARNDLYGGQVGLRVRSCRGRWSWESTGKAGVFGNDMEQLQSSIIDFPDVEYLPATGSRAGDVAFVGDFNLTAIYQLSRCWGLRAGYNLIWMEGVALAADQLNFTNDGSPATLVDGGGVLLHGANVGLEARW